jgi:hypothetical protein
MKIELKKQDALEQYQKEHDDVLLNFAFEFQIRSNSNDDDHNNWIQGAILNKVMKFIEKGEYFDDYDDFDIEFACVYEYYDGEDVVHSVLFKVVDIVN